MKNIMPAPALTLKNQDIITRVKRRYIISVIVTVVWIAAVCVALGVFKIGMDSLTGPGALIASAAIPMFLLKPYKAIFDRNRTGVVESVTLQNKTRVAVTDKRLIELEPSSVVPIVTLIVDCDDGDIITKVYKLNKNQHQYADALVNYYKSGTIVHCYRGIEHPKKESNTVTLNNIEHRLCIVCGNFDSRSHTLCRHCKSTFVD